MTTPLLYRTARAADAQTISALATLVFLDTYATAGVRPDLAREALANYSASHFAQGLADPQTTFVLAESGEHLLGFVEVACAHPCPVADGPAVEVARLYVHPKFHGRGLGKALLAHAERLAEGFQPPGIWLTVWAENAAAIAFYDRLGFATVGSHDHVFEGQHYENQVRVKSSSP